MSPNHKHLTNYTSGLCPYSGYECECDWKNEEYDWNECEEYDWEEYDDQEVCE